MGMEDFFLGALGGAAQAGAQGAAIEFKNEQELLRQQSLLDLQNRYESKALKRRQEAASVARGQLMELAQSGLTSETPTAEELAAMNELGIERPEVEEPRFSDEGLSSLADFLGVDVNTVRGAAETNSLPTLMSAKLKDSDSSALRVEILRNRKTGNLVEVSPEQAQALLAQEDTEGNKVFTTADMEKDDGKALVYTIDGVFELGAEEDEASPRVTELSIIQDRIRNSQAAVANDYNFTNPLMIDPDISMDAARGLLTTGRRTVGSVGVLSGVADFAFGEGVGAPAQKTKKMLETLKEQSRKLSAVATEGRNFSANIPLADVFAPGTDFLTSLLGSKQSVEVTLDAYRNRLLTTREKAQATLQADEANNNDKSKAREVLNTANEALGTLDAFTVSSQVSDLVIPGPTGRPRKLVDAYNSSDELRSFIRSNTFKSLSENEKNLVLLWQQTLLTNGQ